MKLILKGGLIVFLSVMCSSAFGQSQFTLGINQEPQIKLQSSFELNFKLPENAQQSVIRQRSIFNADKLPLFCKLEHNLTRKTNINLRMRLGSLDYVNMLEGKN